MFGAFSASLPFRLCRAAVCSIPVEQSVKFAGQGKPAPYYRFSGRSRLCRSLACSALSALTIERGSQAFHIETFKAFVHASQRSLFDNPLPSLVFSLSLESRFHDFYGNYRCQAFLEVVPRKVCVFSFRISGFSVLSFIALVRAVSEPATCVPPSIVLMRFTNHRALHISIVILYCDLYLGFVLFPNIARQVLKRTSFPLLRYSAVDSASWGSCKSVPVFLRSVVDKVDRYVEVQECELAAFTFGHIGLNSIEEKISSSGMNCTRVPLMSVSPVTQRGIQDPPLITLMVFLSVSPYVFPRKRVDHDTLRCS